MADVPPEFSNPQASSVDELEADLKAHGLPYARYYKLDENGEAVPIFDSDKPSDHRAALEWAEWFETGERVVKKTNVGLFFVSTVFLGINHAFFPGQSPQIFETMIFFRVPFPEPDLREGDKVLLHSFWFHEDLYQERYATRSEALSGHKQAIHWALKAHFTEVPKIAAKAVVAYAEYGWWLISRPEALSRNP